MRPLVCENVTSSASKLAHKIKANYSISCEIYGDYKDITSPLVDTNSN